jgi:hypothetical protein
MGTYELQFANGSTLAFATRREAEAYYSMAVHQTINPPLELPKDEKRVGLVDNFLDLP